MITQSHRIYATIKLLTYTWTTKLHLHTQKTAKLHLGYHTALSQPSNCKPKLGLPLFHSYQTASLHLCHHTALSQADRPPQKWKVSHTNAEDFYTVLLYKTLRKINKQFLHKTMFICITSMFFFSFFYLILLTSKDEKFMPK